MPSVENRVVRMEFDNAQFEARIKQTLNSLSQLDKALKMEGATKGLSDISTHAGFLDRALRLTGARKGLSDVSLEAGKLDKALALNGAKKGLADVDAAAKKIDLNPIHTSLQNASKAFLTFSTIAITALASITSAALAAGANITKALSLDLVLDGFREYELNIGSIQTILANTKADGTNLRQVNDALDQLNRYSDQTIYNFAQMARNIGTFTAAGVDLQTSVNSIKGIANLAAISGSSSEQASTAMYQLSQAISTGTLRLMDWNSVVNAGMGGEVFQKALFETGKAMKTIQGVDMSTTFEEWTANGNSFRDSLQDGWLTAEVLTTTLEGIGGNLDEAALKARGFTDEQARALVELGRLGIESATKIRTFSQLITTVKETISSGWSATFRTIFGDFEEASELFTNINDAVSGFIDRQATARNEMLGIWNNLGGRDKLIKGIKDGFSALADVLKTVKDAFRDIFPKTTAGELLRMTNSFADFMAALKPSEQTLERIKRIFTGFFSALDVGWTIIKEGAGFIKDLFVQVTGLGGGGFLEFAANIGDMFTALREGVDAGQGIKDFFDNLMESLEGPLERIKELRQSVGDFFEGLGGTAQDAAAEVTTWWQPFKDFADGVMEVLHNVGEAISDWFHDLVSSIAEAIDPAEADVVLDALNTSLLGGIAFLIGKWMKNGINFDFTGGFFENASAVLEELTSTLQAMQTNLRADALQKIAIAIGILTASLLVLSTLDAAALSRALGAVAVGMGQLMVAFAVLNNMNAGFIDGTIFASIATGMVILSGAILILSASVAILGNMDWDDLLRGLGAVIVLMGTLTGVAVLISKHVSGIFASSVALSALGAAILILSASVAIFSHMSWEELGRGMSGVAVMLGVLTGAAVLISKHVGKLLLASIGLTAMGTALVILSHAVERMGKMDLGELAKGIGAIAIMLGILVAAAIIMSKNVSGILLTSVALVAMAVSLNLMADAITKIADLSWGELAKGLVGIAGALLILGVAAAAISGSVTGAISIAILAASMILLANALEVIGDLSIGQIAAGLLTLAIALGILLAAGALAETISVGLLALGAAMFLVGASFALFGVGIEKLGKAMVYLGENSDKAYEGALALGKAIPAVLTGLAKGIIEFGTTLLTYLPQIVEIFSGILGALLDAIEENLPKIGAVFLALIETILEVITTAYPQIVDAGLGMLLALLNGLSENIEPIIAAATDLIVNFLNGLTAGIPQIAAAANRLVMAFILAVASQSTNLVNAGVQVLVNFLFGIAANLRKVIDAVGAVILTFISAVGNLARSIAQAGTDALVDFLGGMTNNLYKIVNAVGTMITTFITAVGNNANRVVTAGANALIKFVQGIGNNAGRVVSAGVTTIIKFLNGIASQGVRLARAAFQVVIDFLNALAGVIEQKSGELRQAGMNIAWAIADGITGGLASKARSIAGSAVDAAKGAVGAVTGFLGIHSPSKVFWEIGQHMVDGMALGLSEHGASDKSAKQMADDSVEAARNVLARVQEQLSGIDEFVSPTITPVMDMTQVNQAISDLQGQLGAVDAWSPAASFSRAQVIAKSPNPTAVGASDSETAQGGVKFEQNIYSPTQLSTSDIYRQTRNQITLAKEELDVP